MGKKRPNVVRTTISIPQDLKRRMDKVAEDVNWSAIASKAFENKLAEIIMKKERTIMSAGLSAKERQEVAQRLGATKGFKNTRRYKEGWSHGRSWAKSSAEADQLQRLQKSKFDWDHDRHEIRVTLMTAVPEDPAVRVALAIEPTAMLYSVTDEGVHDYNSGGLDRFWENLVGEDEDQAWWNPMFVRGFVEGALAVWAEVNASL